MIGDDVMKRLSIVLAFVAAFLVSCGNVDDSSLNSNKNTENSGAELSAAENSANVNKEYRIYDPKSDSDGTSDRVMVSGDKIEQLDSLCKAVLEDRTNEFEYSLKQAKEEGWAGGITLNIEVYEDEKQTLSIDLCSYHSYIDNNSSEPGRVTVREADSDIAVDYICGSVENYRALCEAVQKACELTDEYQQYSVECSITACSPDRPLKYAVSDVKEKNKLVSLYNKIVDESEKIEFDPAYDEIQGGERPVIILTYEDGTVVNAELYGDVINDADGNPRGNMLCITDSPDDEENVYSVYRCENESYDELYKLVEKYGKSS